MEYYIYESHLGEYYATDEELDYEDTYCETCGDSDSLVFIGTKEELNNYYQRKINRYNKLIRKYTERGDINKAEELKWKLDNEECIYQEMLRAIQV